ncbi:MULTISPECIES: division/cell wall cluster transcriptional repressor MraZ [Salimicrobium]|uniref:Transcriptional regulator MraZ n=2 Tax=Salimicrobium TaxID=351195 RepID=A0ABY1KPT4_9BACI|nr:MULTISPECIES: division/cell wall cluster transcriptional repressor MraZ [Salimicrobium]SDX33977.1 MraZ protein [Salimicrobium album]SIS61469.1 MraZ protein [Salimicrobium salexigens]
MLMGEHRHNMDSKGRLIIPSRLRDSLGESFVVTRGLDNCLFIYPPEEWGKLERKLQSLPLTKKDARAFTRFFLSGAMESTLDNQGRIHIPLPLREHADLEKACVIVGVSTRLEVWAEDKWDSYMEDSRQSLESFSENLLDLDL